MYGVCQKPRLVVNRAEIFIVSLLYPRVMSMMKDKDRNTPVPPPEGPTEVMGDAFVDKRD